MDRLEEWETARARINSSVAWLWATLLITLSGLVLLTIFVFLLGRHIALPAATLGNGTCPISSISVLSGGVIDTRQDVGTECLNGTVSCAVSGDVFQNGGCLQLTDVTTPGCAVTGNETLCWNGPGQIVNATPNGACGRPFARLMRLSHPQVSSRYTMIR